MPRLGAAALRAALSCPAESVEPSLSLPSCLLLGRSQGKIRPDRISHDGVRVFVAGSCR